MKVITHIHVLYCLILFSGLRLKSTFLFLSIAVKACHRPAPLQALHVTAYLPFHALAVLGCLWFLMWAMPRDKCPLPTSS